MREWFRDMGAVCRRGWWLIALFWGTGVIGAGQEVGRQLYSSHDVRLPSPWWLLVVALGWIVAQQVVIRDRRGGGAQQTGTHPVAQSFFESVDSGLPAGTDLVMRDDPQKGIELRATRHGVELIDTTSAASQPEQLQLEQPQVESQDEPKRTP